MGIPMLKIRRSCDRLIFNMGIPIPEETIFILRRHGNPNTWKDDIYIEARPRSQIQMIAASILWPISSWMGFQIYVFVYCYYYIDLMKLRYFAYQNNGAVLVCAGLMRCDQISPHQSVVKTISIKFGIRQESEVGPVNLGKYVCGLCFLNMILLFFKLISPWTKCLPFRRQYFQMQFCEWEFCILIKFSLKFVPKGLIDNNPAVVYIMAWRLILGDKPLSEPMLTRFTDAYMRHQRGDELRTDNHVNVYLQFIFQFTEFSSDLAILHC